MLQPLRPSSRSIYAAVLGACNRWEFQTGASKLQVLQSEFRNGLSFCQLNYILKSTQDLPLMLRFSIEYWSWCDEFNKIETGHDL
jgi:hypothetical protein